MEWLSEAVSSLFSTETDEDRRKKDDDFHPQQKSNSDDVSSSLPATIPAANISSTVDNATLQQSSTTHTKQSMTLHGTSNTTPTAQVESPEKPKFTPNEQAITDLASAIRLQNEFELRTTSLPLSMDSTSRNDILSDDVTVVTKPPTSVPALPLVGDLQHTGMLTKDQILIFCDKIKAQAQLPETKQRFKDLIAQGKPVEDAIVPLEKEVFLQMSIEPSHGQSCLKQVITTYQHDPQVMVAFQGMMEIQTLLCDEAELTPEQFQQRLSDFHKTKLHQSHMISMANNVRGMLKDPIKKEFLQQRVQEYDDTHPSNATPQEMLGNAMQKLTAAKAMMQQSGIDEKAIYDRAFQMLSDPNFNMETLQRMQRQVYQQQQLQLQQQHNQQQNTPKNE
eukprot:gene4199-6545_t